MSYVVCCPCGNPLDCENLDIVVTLACPRCEQEMSIELDASAGQRMRGVLTVMEGPMWVGQRFVIPVGPELKIGAADDNWLALDGEGVSDHHCVIRLTPKGEVHLRDLESTGGTWVGAIRVVQGKLKSGSSFRVGEYRFRMDFLRTLSDEVVSAATADTPSDLHLPTLRSVDDEKEFLDHVIAKRFIVGRSLIVAFAWTIGVWHAVVLRYHELYRWENWQAIAAALAVLMAILLTGRKVALVSQYQKYIVLAALTAVGIFDSAFLSQPAPAIAALFLAGGLALMITRIPSHSTIVIAMVLCGGAVLTSTVLGLHSVARYLL